MYYFKSVKFEHKKNSPMIVVDCEWSEETKEQPKESEDTETVVVEKKHE